MGVLQSTLLVWLDLWSDRGRAALTIVMLTSLMTGYFILAGFSESIRLLSARGSLRRDLVVIEHGVLDPMDSHIDENLVREIASIGGRNVERISACQFRHMRIEQEIVQLRACPLADWRTVHDLLLVEGRWPAGGDEVAITEGASFATGWQPGSLLTIYGSSFTVTGLMRAGGTNFSAVWMPLDRAESLFEIANVYQVVVVRAVPGSEVETLRTGLENHPSLLGAFDVMYLDSLFDRYSEVVRGLVEAGRLLALAALVTIIFGSYQAMRLSLLERSRAVGLLRVVGFSESQVMQLLTAQAVWLMLLSFGLGAALARGVLFWANRTTPLQMQSVQVPVELTPGVLIVGLPLCLLFSAMGTWLSARSLLAQPVSDLLRL
jgi:hypothetical protein